jgi:hypothetical protein
MSKWKGIKDKIIVGRGDRIMSTLRGAVDKELK